MRNALRRIAFGVLGTGMVVAMAVSTAPVAANAAVAARGTAAVAEMPPPVLIWPVVHVGDKGPRVIKVQYLLNQHGIHVKVDGKFGLATKLAVKFFQKKNGIFPSGIVGAKTWTALVVTIWKGWKGPAVVAAQWELRYVYGYHFVVVDGVFGQMTEWAVKLFQKKYHLSVDGIVGPVTWNALVVHDK
jgi:peptidoglycan hydrolase-like protein with peptidoglycan-binding domain